MTAKILDNFPVKQRKTPPAYTINPETGLPVKYRMFFRDMSKIADAETLGELINVIIPSYSEMAEDQGKFLLRSAYMRDLLVNLKTQIFASLDEEQVAALTEVENRALSHPHDLDFRDSEKIVIWKSEVPLVLLETSYLPVGRAVPPLSSEGDRRIVSNILWLNSTTEQGFLESLHHANIIKFGLTKHM